MECQTNSVYFTHRPLSSDFYQNCWIKQSNLPSLVFIASSMCKPRGSENDLFPLEICIAYNNLPYTKLHYLYCASSDQGYPYTTQYIIVFFEPDLPPTINFHTLSHPNVKLSSLLAELNMQVRCRSSYENHLQITYCMSVGWPYKTIKMRELLKSAAINFH